MEEGTYYVCRNANFSQVITMGDVLDSTLMHINIRKSTRNAKGTHQQLLKQHSTLLLFSVLILSTKRPTSHLSELLSIDSEAVS